MDTAVAALRAALHHADPGAVIAVCPAGHRLFLFVVFPAWDGLIVIPLIIAAGLSLLGMRDLLQTRHAILRNYPILAHLRFMLENIRPEMRQYFFEDDKRRHALRARCKRAVVYQRAKRVLDKRPFGTQYDVYDSQL